MPEVKSLEVATNMVKNARDLLVEEGAPSEIPSLEIWDVPPLFHITMKEKT